MHRACEFILQSACACVCVFSNWHCAMHRQPYFPLHILNRSAPKLTWPGLAWPVSSRLSVLLSPRSMCNCCSSNSPSCPKCLPFGAPCHKIHAHIPNTYYTYKCYCAVHRQNSHHTFNIVHIAINRTEPNWTQLKWIEVKWTALHSTVLHMHYSYFILLYVLERTMFEQERDANEIFRQYHNFAIKRNKINAPDPFRSNALHCTALYCLFLCTFQAICRRAGENVLCTLCMYTMYCSNTVCNSSQLTAHTVHTVSHIESTHKSKKKFKRRRKQKKKRHGTDVGWIRRWLPSLELENIKHSFHCALQSFLYVRWTYFFSHIRHATRWNQ